MANARHENPIGGPIVEAEATPEQTIAKIKYLIAVMRSFKSTNPHNLEYQLAMLFRPLGGYIPKLPSDVVAIRRFNPPVFDPIPLTREMLLAEAKAIEAKGYKRGVQVRRARELRRLAGS